MKRKQLLALGVAGIISMGSVTSSAIAAETTGQNDTIATDNAETETPNEEANEETPEDSSDVEADNGTASDVNDEDSNGNDKEDEAVEEVEAEKLSAEGDDPDTSNPDGDEKPDDDGEGDTVVTSFEELKKRIDEYTGTETLTLVLKGPFEFTDTIEIPEGITVSLTPNDDAQTITFNRGTEFGGSFFNVNGKLLIIGTDEKPFEFKGSTVASIVEPFIKESETGELSLTYASLTDNNVNNAIGQNGGAITNLGGTLLLKDTTIQGNTVDGQTANAIYSTSIIGLQNNIILDEVFLASNGDSGQGSLYFNDALTANSIVNVRCDGTLEYIGSQIAAGEAGTDFSKVAARVNYTNDYYQLKESTETPGLMLAASVSYVLDKQFARPTENTATINVAVKTEKPVTSKTVMYYLIDETGSMTKPQYEQFSKFVSVNKNGENVTLSGVKSFSSNQVIWYYFAEQSDEQSDDGSIVFKDKIARKKVQLYKLTISSPVVSENGTNGYKADLTSPDKIANGATCYYLWIDPNEIEGKSGQEVVDDYLKAKGKTTTVKDGKISINEKNDSIAQMSGLMRLYCYIEKQIDKNTILKSNIRPSSLMMWTPSILQYANPYYEKDGKTYYDWVNLHLDLAHSEGGTVYAHYIDTENKPHVIPLGEVKDGSFDRLIPIRTVNIKAGSSFKVKSYSIYAQIVDTYNGKKYTKISNIISPEIKPTPTPEASPTVTPTETPSPMDPGVDKSVFVGLSSPYLSGAKVVFGVMGAGMDNYKPNKGDIRYYPHRWKAAKSPQTVEQVLAWVTSSGTPQGSFTPSSNGYFYASTSKTTNVPEGSYPVTVVFKKQYFDGTQWVDTGSYAKLDKYFQITKDPNKGVHGGDDNGDDNVYEDHGTYYQVLSNGTVVVVTPAVKANSVSDNVIYKVLPDGTRLIRKLKLIKAPTDGSSVPDIIYIGDDGKAYDLKEDGSASQLKLSPGAEFEAIDGMIYKVLEDGTIVSTGKTANGDIITDNIIYKVLADGTKLIRKLKVFKAPDGVTVPDIIYLGDDGKAYQLLADGTAKEVKLPAGAEFEAIDGLIYIVKEDGSIVSTGKNAAGEEVAKNDHIKNGEAAPTGDETPIVYMVSMLALSMLAGGYVLIRRRKKN